MQWRAGIALFFLAATWSGTARAVPIPPPVEAMIRAAADSGDPGAFRATVDMARRTLPASAREIEALAARLTAITEGRHRQKLQRQGFFEGWKGQGQLGAALSSGNTQSTALSIALAFDKKGWQWDHAFNANLDYQRDFGKDSKSRYFAGYQGNYRINARLYSLGLLSWEDDRFAGFTSRFSEALGLGYKLVDRPDMTLSLEGGPALRQTTYTTRLSENNFAGRAAVNYAWTIRPNLKFSEQASFYGEGKDSTFTSTTALTVTLIGALSAQFSYLVQHETSPPPTLSATNTTGRVTLVYNF